MKRSADSQLTRESLHDEDANSTDGPREFQRATEKELAKRVIKPLPNRRGGSGSPAPQPGPKPSLTTSMPSATSSVASSNISTGPTLDPTSLPSLPTGGFTFKTPVTQATGGFSFSSSIPPIPPFKGSRTTSAGSNATAATSNGIRPFSFRVPTTTSTESTSGSAANGTTSSLPSFGGLPPFKPTATSSPSSDPTSKLAAKSAGSAKSPSNTEPTSKSSFSFGIPPSNSSTTTSSLPFSFPKPSATPKHSVTLSESSSNPKPGATPPDKSTPVPQNMTPTAKSMSSIFSSMTSESPPRPSLPGFKAPDGGPAISPEKGASSTFGKSKPGSFSFGGGIPKKPAPEAASRDTEMKEKADKGKGRATTSTGTFGLGKSLVEDVAEEDEQQGDHLPDGLDAGDFDPALNDDGTPLRKPHDHPDHQESYEHDPELKYWLHLRGLNTSFLREIISMQREDPFMDLSGVFRSYKEFRRGVIGEMVEWLRANGKGDGTESPGEEESDSEDEEMYYDEARAAEVEADLMDDSDEPNDPTSIAERQFREQQERERLQPVDRDKTPPAGPQLPRAPVGGLYIFGGKPVSSFAGAATNGGGFTPTGAAAAFKPPPPATYTFERPGLKRPKTPVASPSAPTAGFTSVTTKNDSMQGIKSTSPKLSQPSNMQGVKQTSPKPAQPSKSGFAPSGFTPSGSGFAPTATTAFGAKPSLNPVAATAPTGPGAGFTPSTSAPFGFKPPSDPPASTASTNSVFGFTPSSNSGFTPSSNSGFSAGAPPTKPPSPSISKAPEMPLKSPTSTSGVKSSTFPGFGPITGGPSGSPFGTKPASGDKPIAPSTSPGPFGAGTGRSSFGSGGGFSGFGSAWSASGGVTSAGGITSGDTTSGTTGFGSSTTKPPSAFGTGGDPAKSPFPFGNKPSSVWPASTPEAAKPGGLFGTPPSTGGSSSIFGLAPSTGPSPFGSGGSIFGVKPTTSATAALAFGGSGPVFGSSGSPSTIGSRGGPAGNPSKRPDDTSSKSSNEKDELDGDDENTTPKATPAPLPSDPAPAAPTRTGIANPWATAPSTSTSSFAPTAGGPFKFGMGSKPAPTEPESPAAGLASKSAGFSFADPPAAFNLPSAGSFSFADPPKSTAGSGFSFADPPKSTAGGVTASFTNPFASPPKTGTLPGFGAISGGFGSSTFGSGAPAPSLFGGKITPGGTFSFGAPSTLVPKGPFLSSTTGGATSTTSFSAVSGTASGSAPSDTGAAGSSTGAGFSQDSDIAPEGGAGLALGDDKFDQPGPGEEMEESLFTVRGKVMRFSEGVWVDMGIGQIRLYKHKETGAKRVFARNSKSGRILLNFAPFTKMEPKLDEQKAKFMRMTAMDDGKLVKILVKLKEESEASQLVNVLQKEVEVLS